MTLINISVYGFLFFILMFLLYAVFLNRRHKKAAVVQAGWDDIWRERIRRGK
jgi:cbb3-type cytochrome oxidase subunit 3